MTAVFIDELNVYPLKSARGISKTRVRLAATGFEWDRHWLVIREDGMFLTQRTHPLLTHIATELTSEGLILTSAGLKALMLPLAPRGTGRPVRIWKDSCEGLDQGDEAASWVSRVLGEPTRIVRTPLAETSRFRSVCGPLLTNRQHPCIGSLWRFGQDGLTQSRFVRSRS